MTDRIVQVNRHAHSLLERAGITPPDSGVFAVADLDARLRDSGLTTTEKMAIKGHLRDCRLLAPGRPIDDVRR